MPLVEAGRRVVIPWGFVRVLDAAATGAGNPSAISVALPANLTQPPRTLLSLRLQPCLPPLMQPAAPMPNSSPPSNNDPANGMATREK